LLRQLRGDDVFHVAGAIVSPRGSAEDLLAGNLPVSALRRVQRPLTPSRWVRSAAWELPSVCAKLGCPAAFAGPELRRRKAMRR